jgi:hypothetical protein
VYFQFSAWVAICRNDQGLNVPDDLAAAKGQTAVAEAIQELSPEIATIFLDWFEKR